MDRCVVERGGPFDVHRLGICATLQQSPDNCRVVVPRSRDVQRRRAVIGLGFNVSSAFQGQFHCFNIGV